MIEWSAGDSVPFVMASEACSGLFEVLDLGLLLATFAPGASSAPPHMNS